MNLSALARLDTLARGSDAALLATRIAIGGFLVWGVWDNITSAEHMQTFVAFLKQFGFPFPSCLRRSTCGSSSPPASCWRSAC